MLTGSNGSAAVTVSGLVPDGNASVSITLLDGHTVRAIVSDNVYSVETPDTPVTITDLDSAGQTVVSKLPRP